MFRLRVEGLEHVPETGGVILAPNHFSAMDHWFVGLMLRRRVRFMAKSQLFRGRFLELVLPRLGAFPVRRGQHDEDAITTALTLLGADGVVVIYPEGGRSRTGRIGNRARPGVGRLALRSGAAIIPVAIIGSERARNWRRLQFPAVTVRYGVPIRPEPTTTAGPEHEQRISDGVLQAVRALHAAP